MTIEIEKKSFSEVQYLLTASSYVLAYLGGQKHTFKKVLSKNVTHQFFEKGSCLQEGDQRHALIFHLSIDYFFGIEKVRIVSMRVFSENGQPKVFLVADLYFKDKRTMTVSEEIDFKLVEEKGRLRVGAVKHLAHHTSLIKENKDQLGFFKPQDVLQAYRYIAGYLDGNTEQLKELMPEDARGSLMLNSFIGGMPEYEGKRDFFIHCLQTSSFATTAKYTDIQFDLLTTKGGGIYTNVHATQTSKEGESKQTQIGFCSVIEDQKISHVVHFVDCIGFTKMAIASYIDAIALHIFEVPIPEKYILSL